MSAHPDAGLAQPCLELPPGTLAVEHLREVIESQAAARGKRFLVLTHRSPDPDALGACCGMRHLLKEGFGCEPVVATMGRIHRAENVAMVRELGLVFEDYRDLDLSQFAGSVLVDSQPSFGHTFVPEEVPLLAVIDHHETPQHGIARAAEVPHFDVRHDVGATASVVYEYLRDAGVPLDQHTASALFCGVRFDTADLSHHLSELDEEAYFATLRLADRPCVVRIQRPPLPVEYYRELDRALQTARRYGPLIVGLFHEVPNPESVAEMADFFLRMEGCQWTLAGGAFEDDYFISLRTDYAFGPAYDLLEAIMGDEGSFGGHGRIAGGQIPLEDKSEIGIRKVQRGLRQRALEVLRSQGYELESAESAAQPIT